MGGGVGKGGDPDENNIIKINCFTLLSSLRIISNVIVIFQPKLIATVHNNYVPDDIFIFQNYTYLMPIHLLTIQINISIPNQDIL